MVEITLVGAVVVALAAAVNRWPPIALALFLCMFALEQCIQGLSSYFVEHGELINVIVCGLVVWGCASLAQRGELRFANGGLALGLAIVLYGQALLSMLSSEHHEAAQQQFSMCWPYVLTAIVLCPFLMNKSEDVQLALQTMLAIGAGVVALLLLTGNWRSEGREALLLGEGDVIGNPLAIGEVAGMVAMLGLILRLSGAPVFVSLGRWVVVGLALILAIASGSRGQFFGALVAALIFFPLARPQGGAQRLVIWMVTGLTLVLLAVFLLETLDPERASRWGLEQMRDDMAAGRIESSLDLLERWSQGDPWELLFGLGNSASFDIIGVYPHFVALEVLGEEGLAGFMLYLALLALAASRVLRIRKEDCSLDAQVALASLWFFLLMLSCKQGSLLGNYNYFMLGIILCRVIGLATSNRPVAARRWSRTPASFVNNAWALNRGSRHVAH